jgi:hypothetical protein
MLRDCASRQLDQDVPMIMELQRQHEVEVMLQPNLFIKTGPIHDCENDCPPDCVLGYGMLLPVLVLRSG